MENCELAEEQHKQIIKEFEKLHSSFIDSIWGDDLPDMQLLSEFDKEIPFLLCVIDTYSKYTWSAPLQDKKGFPNTNAFQKTLHGPGRKPKKTLVDKGSEFYDRSVKPWLEDTVVEMYSTHNAGKSAVAKRFIRTLKNNI